MKIVLASTSAVKVEACRKAFANMASVEICPVQVPSGVAEQPVGDETLLGAFNRIHAAQKAVPDADLYVSIESGIFPMDGKFIDRAVVVLARSGAKPDVTYSDGVEFPAASFEEAKRRGFSQWTVGKVMQERGIVTQHDDPHKDLSGKSRSTYINDAVCQAVSRQIGISGAR